MGTPLPLTSRLSFCYISFQRGRRSVTGRSSARIQGNAVGSLADMRTYILTLFLILICCQWTLNAQENQDINIVRCTELSRAYGFVLGQQMALEIIEKKFPALEKDVAAARQAFSSSAIGECPDEIETELAHMLGESWPRIKNATVTESKAVLAKVDWTLEGARNLIEAVQRRAKGDIPEETLSVLLSAGVEPCKA